MPDIRLIRELGSGGMGRVFLGRSAGGRPVAVKVIGADLGADPEFRERFRREVAAAQKVNGLYTALVVDADLDGPTPWLATAYVAGPSLADAVGRHGPLPVTAVRMLAAGLAEGLAAIHAAGLVHRDLKPSNVLLADDGPRVIDFGISRAAEASVLTRTGLVIGSPGFMSPEQAEGREVGTPSDVFSLGAVLVFAATGQGPFGTGPTAALVEVGDPDLGEGWLAASVIDGHGLPAGSRPAGSRPAGSRPAGSRPAGSGPQYPSRGAGPVVPQDYPATIPAPSKVGSSRAAPTITAGSAGSGSSGIGRRMSWHSPRIRLLALAAGACIAVVAMVVALTTSSSSPGSTPAARLIIARTLADPGGQGVLGLAFTPDGEELAAANSNGATYLWLLATHRVDETIKVPGSPSSVAASPDGRYLAVGSTAGEVYQVIRNDGTVVTKKLPRPSGPGFFPPGR